MTNHKEQFNNAQALMQSGNLEEAMEIFTCLKAIKEIKPLCDYQLAAIHNVIGNPETSYDLYYSAFEEMPNITSILYDEDRPNRDYVFEGKKPEKQRIDCPLCGKEGMPHWVYSMSETIGYNPFINPIRMWMYCICHHLFARHFPEKIFMHNSNPRKANPRYFVYYSHILNNIRKLTKGTSLFEVGLGASECLLTAREIGFDVFGIDVIERHVKDAKKLYGLNTETADFNEYQSDRLWDVIMMGDVLEHVTDPVRAIEKSSNLLKENGILWVSTPNFESAFTLITGHSDGMRRQQYHLNYFSRKSLYALLGRFNLTPVEYRISGHYHGSMEVIAVKQ